MKRTRNNTFETNSSSTHTLVLCNEHKKYIIPKNIIVRKGTMTVFDGDTERPVNVVDTVSEKLCFAIASQRYNLESLFNCLNDIGIQSINLFGLKINLDNVSEYFEVDDLENKLGIEFSINHECSSEMSDTIREFIYNETKMKNFLFNKKSFVLLDSDGWTVYEELSENYNKKESKKYHRAKELIRKYSIY